jgi:hypothetical protein
MGCTSEFCESFMANFSSGNFSGPVGEVVAGSVLGVLIGFGVLILLMALVAFYVYTSITWYTIGRKLKYKNSWLAWVPIVKWAMILQMGKFHWAWIFLILIPVLGWIPLFVLLIIAMWRIYEKRKYPGWFSLAQLVPKVGGILHLIVIGFVAWDDRK